MQSIYSSITTEWEIKIYQSNKVDLEDSMQRQGTFKGGSFFEHSFSNPPSVFQLQHLLLHAKVNGAFQLKFEGSRNVFVKTNSLKHELMTNIVAT